MIDFLYYPKFRSAYRIVAYQLKFKFVIRQRLPYSLEISIAAEGICQIECILFDWPVVKIFYILPVTPSGFIGYIYLHKFYRIINRPAIGFAL